MQENHESHVIGTCATCGFRFDLLFGIDCPRCRSEHIKSAFAPIDPLRTALGVGLDIEKLLTDQQTRYYRGQKFFHDDMEDHVNARPSFRVPCQQMSEQESDVPEDCKVPIDEAAQIYELRRMFRL